MVSSGLLNGDAFPKHGEAAWLEAVRKSLKGAAADTLVSRTDDGLAVEPLPPRAAAPGVAMRQQPGRRWRIVSRADDPDPARAGRQARRDIAEGADGLALVFEGGPNAFGYGLPPTGEALAEVLAEVPLHETYLRLDAHPGNRTTVEMLVAFLARQRIDPARLDLSLGIEPAAVFAGTGRLRMSIEALEASMPQSLAHFFTLGVPAVLLESDGRVFHNAGATEAQELGAMLASGVSYLRLFERARQPLVYAAPHIGFCVGVDQDQLLGLAKLRALRLLWQSVLESCAIPPAPVRVHAETSWRMLTERDAETNIVRNTVACFAAVAGGADSLSVLPHTQAHGLPDAFARRLARNTQLILAEEAHIGFTADPAAGSGAVEALTASLCEAAWEEFRRIEGEGGTLRSLQAGHLQGRIEAARAARAARFAAREREIVGTTAYPSPAEPGVATLAADRRPIPTEGAAFCRRLDARRIDEDLGEAAP